MTLNLFARLGLAALAVSAALAFGVVALWPTPSTPAAPVPKVESVKAEDISEERLELLDNRRVQREIKMTPEQRVKLLDGLDALRDEYAAEADRAGANRPPIPGGAVPPAWDYERERKAFEERRRAFAATAITPKQLTRLSQMEVRLAGEFAPMIPWVAEKMNMTDKLKERVVDVLRTNEDFRPGGQAAPGPGWIAFNHKTPAEMRELVEAELNKDQRQVWVELAGDKLSFDVDQTQHEFNLRGRYRGQLRREGDGSPGGKGGK